MHIFILMIADDDEIMIMQTLENLANQDPDLVDSFQCAEEVVATSDLGSEARSA